MYLICICCITTHLGARIIHATPICLWQTLFVIACSTMSIDALNQYYSYSIYLILDRYYLILTIYCVETRYDHQTVIPFMYNNNRSSDDYMTRDTECDSLITFHAKLSHAPILGSKHMTGVILV